MILPKLMYYCVVLIFKIGNIDIDVSESFATRRKGSLVEDVACAGTKMRIPALILQYRQRRNSSGSGSWSHSLLRLRICVDARWIVSEL